MQKQQYYGLGSSHIINGEIQSVKETDQMTSILTEEELQEVMADARAMRSQEVSRLCGLLFRRRAVPMPSNAVNG